MNDSVVHLEGLTRSFVQGDVQIDVLRGVNMTIAPGEIVALLGPSGSGKSTLLQAVGLLEGGFGGKIMISGTDASQMDGDERTTLRRDTIGSRLGATLSYFSGSPHVSKRGIEEICETVSSNAVIFGIANNRQRLPKRIGHSIAAGHYIFDIGGHDNDEI